MIPMSGKLKTQTAIPWFWVRSLSGVIRQTSAQSLPLCAHNMCVYDN
jgi:hypothetical protein